ncbi:mechanosensitive ion channel family protein [Halocatena marina]|uniref:mechanosensitive ion channel family protein n=1 Tax=Halocatena marina TaxID=2934937 RepID=UPI00200CDADD|nr:mechanosensitive ion channel family protein [Halocatena marina]
MNPIPLQPSTDVIANIQGQMIEAIITFVTFVVAFVALYYVSKRLFKHGVQQGMQSRGVNATVISLSVSVAEVLALLVSVAAASTIAGFEVVMAAFATLSSALALAIGFAAQDLISNFVSGIFILRDEPFHVGDWIEWNGMKGVVREIQLRTTKIETFDNEVITVPNSDLANNPVTNPVSNDTLRLPFLFGIGYDDDIKQAKRIIVEEAKQIDGVLSNPEPSVRLTELGDSYVGLAGRVWIGNPTRGEYVRVRSDFVEAVKERFDEEGIDIPYPYTELTGEVAVSELADTPLVDQRDPVSG